MKQTAIIVTDGALLYDGDNAVPCNAQTVLQTVMRNERAIIYCFDYESIAETVEQLVMRLPKSDGRSDGIQTSYNINTHFYSAKIILGKHVCVIRDMRNIYRDDTIEDLADIYGGYTECETLYNTALTLAAHGMDGNTISSMAMRDYIGNDYKGFKERFPALDSETYKRMRSAYFGAYVDAIPGEYGECVSYDVNSLYPYVLSHMRMPYGVPQWVDGEAKTDGNQCAITLCTFAAELKDDGLPMLTDAVKLFGYDNRAPNTCGYITRAITDVDMQLLYDNYHVSMAEIHGSWIFDTSLGLFDDYVNTWYAKKKTSNKRNRRIAKLMLNSLVGKFGTAVNRPILRLQCDDDGELRYMPETADAAHSLSYMPVAAYVNAHARRILLDAIHNNHERFIYADTDGIILQGTERPVGIDVNQTKIGAWKNDHTYRRLRILAPRRYCGEDVSGETVMRLSGVPKPDVIPYDDFTRGTRHMDGNGNVFVL